ncbi:MAG: hypothetical protein ACTHNW_10145 [Mucilaginibacter sp.]
MKRFVILLLSTSVFVASCKKETQQHVSNGTLIGYDLAMCAFCGGIKVVISNDTTKNPPPFYRINTTLSNLGIPEGTAFPINITLDWKKDTSALAVGNYILVSNVHIQH